ncbi:serine/threonine-protein kinase [Myxococcaceae bacterium GXIMD 01537]
MSAAPRDTPRFGKYRLVDRLAVGGMAEIFLAFQADSEGYEKPVVIKRIRPHLTKEASFVKLFLNEARLAAQLNHPNIVQIYDLGKLGESYFIAMEYIFGRDMRRILPKSEGLGIPFPLVYALKIASSALAGLHYAHTKVDWSGNPLNIVHRDVSPENIFVAFDGTVKVLDFGIAKANNLPTGETRAGELRGKLSYMSPEQCLGKPVDCRSDVFSLGVTLYEWLTGFKLFTGESEIAVMRNIAEGKIYAPSYFKADIPGPVEAILMRALERDRDRRYQSAAEMQEAIDTFLNAYEFTPTPLHLSNFLKQLFMDEMEAEQGRLSARAPTSDAPPAAEAPAEPRREGRVPSERILSVPLSAEVLDALDAVAKRNNVPVARMVGDILASWLKYR